MDNDDTKNYQDRVDFAEILSYVKDYYGLSWKDFALRLGWEDITIFAYSKVKLYGQAVDKLSDFIKVNKIILPDALKKKFDLLKRKYILRKSEADYDIEPAFIKALGLDTNMRDSSTAFHQGAYYHFALDDDGRIVSSRCILSSSLGDDGTPLYKSRRRVPSYGYRRYVGTYFANGKNLYLLGTPLHSVDMRLAVFNILPGERQDIIRGIVLGVSQRGAVLTSRCALVRKRALKPKDRTAIFLAPMPPDQTLPCIHEIADYLRGVEKPEYIKVSTGE